MATCLAGVRRATWAELTERFGVGSEARFRGLARLRHLHELAARTGKLCNFFVFGSFVSAAPDPRDVDVVLIMTGDFRLEESPPVNAARCSRTRKRRHATERASSGCAKAWCPGH